MTFVPARAEKPAASGGARLALDIAYVKNQSSGIGDAPSISDFSAIDPVGLGDARADHSSTRTSTIKLDRCNPRRTLVRHARLALDCAAMAATGWVVGRLNRASAILAVIAFAVTLTINIPWLLRLIVNTLRDNHYLSSLVSTATSQTFLFGSLLGRRAVEPPAKETNIDHCRRLALSVRLGNGRCRGGFRN